MSTKGGPVFTFSLPGSGSCPPSVTPLALGKIHSRAHLFYTKILILHIITFYIV